MSEPNIFEFYNNRQPAHIKNRDDYVSWMAYHKEDPKKNLGHWNFYACYAPLVSSTKTLGDYEIHCVPYETTAFVGERDPLNQVSPADYLDLMVAFAETGLLPPEVDCFIDSKRRNCMVISRGDTTRHSVYVATCIYRWVDCKMRTMATALDIYRELGLPWLQVFHYVATRSGFNTAHGFFDTSTNQGGTAGGLNPATGLALQRMAHTSPKELQEKRESPTASLIDSWVREVNPKDRQVTVSFGRYKVCRYLYSSPEDILRPEHSVFYTEPKLTTEDIGRLLVTSEERKAA